VHKLIVITQPEDFTLSASGVSVVTARQYLTDPAFVELRNVRVYNLCRSYRYQSAGYYVSLLAEARGHSAFPNITTIQDLKSQTLIRALSEELDHEIQRSLSALSSLEFTLSIYFGKNTASRYDQLCHGLYSQFEAPLLRAQFVREKQWELKSIRPISLKEIPDAHMPFVQEFAQAYFARKKHRAPQKASPMYDLAILLNPGEKSPPSDRQAIAECVRAADRLGMAADLIDKNDLADIGEYDGLFIRATTSVNDFTYRFSRKAAAQGLVVIDDPPSILRCTNKVYLAELLIRNRLPAPRTVVVHRSNVDDVESQLGFPCILKQPDSSFSVGVKKVSSVDEYRASTDELFSGSDFIIAQEFMPTEFDWRVGILNGTPLFVCKYFMARGHWQIYNWEARGASSYGAWETLPVSDAPKPVMSLALRAASLVGNGFYGVDLKQVGQKVFVIEVNDNPSIEHGVEDSVLGSLLYDRIMIYFRDQISRRGG